MFPRVSALAPKAEANGKWKDLELLTEGLVLVTEVVMVFVKDGPPPTPELALAGTCGNFLFLIRECLYKRVH